MQYCLKCTVSGVTFDILPAINFVPENSMDGVAPARAQRKGLMNHFIKDSSKTFKDVTFSEICRVL